MLLHGEVLKLVDPREEFFDFFASPRELERLLSPRRRYNDCILVRERGKNDSRVLISVVCNETSRNWFEYRINPKCDKRISTGNLSKTNSTLHLDLGVIRQLLREKSTLIEDFRVLYQKMEYKKKLQCRLLPLPPETIYGILGKYESLLKSSKLYI